jgi:hypothetical protein
VDIPDRPAKGRLGQIGVLLAPNRVVKDEDADGAGSDLVSAKLTFESVLQILGLCVFGFISYTSFSNCSVSG